MTTARIALVGAGWWGSTIHLPSLAEYPGAEVVALCDSDPDRLAETAAEFGIPERFTGVEELCASGVADGVLVAVSHTSHYDVCRAALDSHLHVLVEKPMVLTARDAWDLVNRARTSERELMIGQTYHFTSAAARAKAAVPELGELMQVVGTFSSHTQAFFSGKPARPDGRGGGYADPSLVGGGQGHTQLSHLLGAVCWLTGLQAEQVFAYMENRGLAVDLLDSVAVRFSGGALGSFSGLGAVPSGHPGRQAITIYGTEGMLSYDLGTATGELRLAGHEPQQFTVADGEARYPNRQVARAFADVIAGRARNDQAPPEPAARSVEILDAAYRSAETGLAVSIEQLS